MRSNLWAVLLVICLLTAGCASTEESPTAPVAPALLPAPLYYLAEEGGGASLWRVEADGATQVQIADCCILAYAVSPASGWVAYLPDETTLVVADALGGEVATVDIATVGYSTQSDTALAWAPDGSRVALGGERGVYAYAPGSGNLTQLFDGSEDSTVVAPLSHDAWSPDGRTLLIVNSEPDRDMLGMLAVESGELVMSRLAAGRRFTWSLDSQVVYVSSNFWGMMGFLPSLLVFDPLANEPTLLITVDTDDEGLLVRYVDAAQEGPDGLLYYFYGEEREVEVGVDTGRLSMTRSNRDGITGRERLRDDVYVAVDEVLWAPDMSLALIAGADPWLENQTGAVTLLPADGQEPAVVLPFVGYGLQWGPAGE